MAEPLPAGYSRQNDGQLSQNPCGQMPGGQRPLEASGGGREDSKRAGLKTESKLEKSLFHKHKCMDWDLHAAPFLSSWLGYLAQGLWWHNMHSWQRRPGPVLERQQMHCLFLMRGIRRKDMRVGRASRVLELHDAVFFPSWVEFEFEVVSSRQHSGQSYEPLCFCC